MALIPNQILGRDPVTGLILHDKQLAFIESPAKRKVICSGRRGGKTTGTAVMAARGLVAGRRVLYAAPTQEQTDQFWEYQKEFFAEGIAKGRIYKNETKRILEGRGGIKGRIKAKTAWDADTMRGDYADLMFLEEYAQMKSDAWDKVGAPMLLDNNGDAVFISTPLRRNHFYKLYLKAMSDTSGRWGHWHFTSFDNPYLSREALEEITQDMTQDAFRQEILAEFLENQGAVFRNIQACLSNIAAVLKDHKGHTIVLGADWGKQADFTAISVGCATCKTELAIDRFNQIDYAFQRKRLAQMVYKWGVTDILAEANAMGVPIIEELQRMSLPVRGFYTTATSKPPLIENLALIFEREEWKFIDNPIWTAELEAYERKISETTGRSSYSAPEGLHDDTVIARALMVRAADSAGPAFIEL